VAERPLDGVTVVTMEQAVAAPFATRLLADLGARVVKIERVDGGDFARGYDRHVRGMASHFVWLNRSKESFAVDVKTDAGIELVRALIERADVFVQNLGPGAVERLGLDAATLRLQRTELIAVNMSGYGQDGPYRDRKAFDMLVQAESGLVAVTGTPGHPVKTGVPSADIAAGMFASNAVLAALVQRGRTGAGATVDVSMFDSLVEWVQHPLLIAMYTGTEVPRTGLAHASIVPYDAYPTTDGRVLIGVQNDRQWRALTDALGRDDLQEDPDLARNIDRCEQRARVDRELARTTGGLSTSDLMQRLNAADVPVAQVNELGDVLEHPQLSTRRRWRSVDSEVGAVRALLPPASFDGFEPAMGGVPALGQHTRAIAEELGRSPAEIEALREESVIA
jgi:itaconate CoA-transferase